MIKPKLQSLSNKISVEISLQFDHHPDVDDDDEDGDDDDGDSMLLFVWLIAVDCGVCSSKHSRQLQRFGKSGSLELHLSAHVVQLRIISLPATGHKAMVGPELNLSFGRTVSTCV